MFERFTRTAREAVVVAQEMARDLQSERIGAEHVLLGALWCADGVARDVVGDAGLDFRTAWQQLETGLGDRDAEALRELGIDLDQVRERVEKSFGEGALSRRRPGWRRGKGGGHLPFTREAKKSLELALREAVRLGHRQIGTEHLLLGLTRSDAAAVTELITRAGTTPDAVHDSLDARLRRAA